MIGGSTIKEVMPEGGLALGQVLLGMAAVVVLILLGRQVHCGSHRPERVTLS